MEQYALYLRKSRSDDPNATVEETLSRHEKILIETARKMNLSIVKIFREVVSGESISDRPQMKELLNEVDAGLYAGVLVVELERLSRGNNIDQGIIAQSFQISDTKIITPNKTYDPNDEHDSEMIEFGMFMSRREYKTIVRRMQRGKISSVNEGKFLGSRPPYGYIIKKLKKGNTLEPHPDQALVVKMIFDMYVNQRIGVSLIVRKLNSLRIPPAKGDVWVNPSIRDILRNPVYCGRIRWNWRPHIKKIVEGKIVKERPRAKEGDWLLVDGLHPALVEQETFDLAQQFLGQNFSRPCPKDMPIKNPLAGLIECGLCGRKMVRRPYNKKELPPTIMCPSTACKNISSHLQLVENRLITSLEQWLGDYKTNWDLPAREDGNINQTELKERTLKNLDEEIRTLEKQSASLYDLLEQGIYTKEKFLERSRNISERIAVAQNERANIQAEIAKEQNQNLSQKEIIPKVEKVLELYRLANDPALKNELLSEILDKAVYTKTKKSHWTMPSDEFGLILYPKLIFND